MPLKLKDSPVTLALKLLSFLKPGKNRVVDIPYGKETLTKFDEYPVDNKQAPIIMFWHGGGWTDGNKDFYRFIGSLFQSMGFRSIIVSYPLYPRQTFPGFIEDAQAAISTVHNAYPDAAIYTSGHSAGGNTALIVCMQSNLVAGCISIAAPCDINKQEWGHIFGDAIDKELDDPRSYIDKSKKSKRYLLFHGRHDSTVSFHDSVSLQHKLQAHGAESKLILLPTDHAMILLYLVFSKRIRKQIKEFVR